MKLKKSIRCMVGIHNPMPEAVYGYMGQAGCPAYNTEFAYIAQKCSRCGKVLSVLWPPKEEVLKQLSY